MSKQQNPEIPQKLIDALIRTVIEQGFSPGIDAIAERAGINKMAAGTQFANRVVLTIAALERVGGETRKSLNVAVNQPDIKGSPFDCDTNRVVDCLDQRLTDRDNPIGFITCCLLGHPDPGSKIRAAAMKEHAAIAGWLENLFRTRHVMPRPEKAANAVMAVLHGTYANVLGSGVDAWKSIIETGLLLRYILSACSKEKTAVPRTLERKGGRARRSRKQAPAPDPAAARLPGDP